VKRTSGLSPDQQLSGWTRLCRYAPKLVGFLWPKMVRQAAYSAS
jgi:hypothetical protein